MLYYIARDRTSATIRGFLEALGDGAAPFLAVLTYEEIFSSFRCPVGHLIFTDHDRLTPWELEAAEAAARAVERAAPAARIYNRPARVLCRYQMLRRLRRLGLLPYDAVRLDEERPPESYPVFIRREAEALGPETAPLADLAAYRAAIATLLEHGQPLAGRIAIGFHAECDAGGVFRKYGAIRFGSRIVPQHLYFSRDWMVKRTTIEREPWMIAEEAAFAEGNPHADALMPLFHEAAIDFGRADYAVTSSGLVLYEINTNPNLPRRAMRDDGRDGRRAMAVEAIIEGFRSLDAGPLPHRMAKFRPPRSGAPDRRPSPMPAGLAGALRRLLPWR